MFFFIGTNFNGTRFQVKLLSFNSNPFEDGDVVAGIGENVRFLFQRPEDVSPGGSEVDFSVVACAEMISTFAFLQSTKMDDKAIIVVFWEKVS